MTLPLILRPKTHEPGHGVLQRLCVRSGRTFVSSFATSIGVSSKAVLAGHDVGKIAELAGVSTLATAWWSPVISATARLVTIAGEELSLGDWSVARRRHCVECFREDVAVAERYGIPADWFVSHRSWWDIQTIAACPTHGVPLASTCPACVVTLTWRDARRLVCPSCRKSLLVSAMEIEDPLGRYVAARLGIGNMERPAILENLPVRHAIRMCARLGRAGLAAEALATTAGVPPLEHGLEGFRRALLGQSALDDIFDRAVARRVVDAPDGLGGAYGWLHNEWIGTDDPTGEPFREPLRRHAIAHGIVAPDEDRLGASPVPTINLKQAAAKARVSPESMRSILESAGAIPLGSRRGVSFALDPRVAGMAKPRVALRRVALELLGVSRSALSGLASGGHLDVADEAALRRSAEKLLGSVYPQLCAGRAPSGTTSLLKAAVAVSVPLSRIVDAVIQGTIPAWRSDVGVGLAAVLVRTIDLLPMRARPDGYSCVAASRELGLHQECVRALATSGALVRSAGGLFTVESVETLGSDYVTGAFLAGERGCSPASLIKSLAARGVEPAWPVVTHRQAIYRRSDIRLADLKIN